MLRKIIIISLSFLIYMQGAQAAKVHDLSERSKPSGNDSAQLMVQNTTMKTLSTFKDMAGHEHIRSQQLYKGIPIWNYQVIEHRGQAKAGASTYTGHYVSDIESDLRQGTEKPQAQIVTWVLKQYLATKPAAAVIGETRVKPYIYLDTAGIAHKVYEVSFSADSDKKNHPSIPIYLVDAQSMKVYQHWDAIMHQAGSGPGGNRITGRYLYGKKKDFPPFSVNVKLGATQKTCVMENAFMRTVDLQNGTMGFEPFEYICHPARKNYNHEEEIINGAYGVINDAHAFGQTIIKMYQQWYQVDPLPIPLVMRVHYGDDYANAMWDSWSMMMSFGDGDAETMYPPVTLDVAAHEVGHGITQFASDLIYDGQSGGLNESFSDMSAQAAEYYFYGENDWKIGAKIMKSGEPLRYMNTPTKDGYSIDHASDYTDDMDVHYSSGVFNRAFYLLATTRGWDTQMAYTVFYFANLAEWQRIETFASAGCGAIRAVKTLSSWYSEFKPEDLISALEKVGIHYNADTEHCDV